MSVAVGSRLGHYEIRAPLGAGGMGEIYLAQDTRLGRRVALKILPQRFISDSERLRRFELEAKAISALNHPNIITIYEVGHSDSVHFIATEFIEGETLRQRMNKAPLSLREAVGLMQQVVSALVAAHAAGIVHRDLKPENVMIRHDGYVKVLDFGLAKLIEQKVEHVRPDPDAPTLALKTDPGKVMGTVSYMSPEQARGQEVDARSDIFSLGVLLYEMVAGRLPFTGQSPADVVSAILNEEPPLLDHRSGQPPSEISWIVSRMLAKDREERYQNSRSLASDLRRLKQRLDFEAELNRSSQATFDKTQTITDTDTQIFAPLSTRRDPFRTELNVRTSSAEYILHELKRRKGSVLAFLILLLAGLSVAGYLALRERPIETLAVLPFSVTGNDPEVESLSENLTARLINNLSQLPKLKVKSLNLVSQYKDRQTDTRAIGQALDTQALLVGRITRRGNNFTINIELINARDNTTIWGNQYQPKFADLLLAEQEITRDVAQSLRVALGGAARDQRRFEAQQLYQKARHYWNQRTPEGLQKARELFEQVVAADPDNAQAHAGLADCYNILVLYNALAPREAFPKAKTAALRALELDGSLAEAHAALALGAYIFDWDWVMAEREFQRALDLNPNYAPTHQWYSTYLAVRGRADEAIAEAQRTQQLDPLSLIINAQLGRILYYTGKYEEAVTQLQKTIALDSSFFAARRYLGQVYEEQGRYEQAIAELTQALTLSGGSAVVKVELGHAYAVAGKKDEARRILGELSNSASAYQLAAIYAALGEKEEAFAQLHKALIERSDRLIYLKIDPRLKPLRGDARFTHLLQKIGL
jgi:serine/threonine protein kinase/Flp pilus assembly protein TadD